MNCLLVLFFSLVGLVTGFIFTIYHCVCVCLGTLFVRTTRKKSKRENECEKQKMKKIKNINSRKTHVSKILISSHYTMFSQLLSFISSVRLFGNIWILCKRRKTQLPEYFFIVCMRKFFLQCIPGAHIRLAVVFFIF